MRIFFILLFALTLTPLKADKFTVFEKDGWYGIKDDNGEITVPAVHEFLGWSDGSTIIFNGVIGFRKKNGWGILTAKNKVISGNKFYSLVPFERGLIKASIKGRFSNSLFYGLLKPSGETTVSFNYSQLDQIDGHLVVGRLDQYQSRLGVITFDNKTLVPLEYEQISFDKDWVVAGNSNKTCDLYFASRLLYEDLDSISKLKGGFEVFKNGYAGYVDSSGSKLFECKYKSISKNLEAIEFPMWEIEQGGQIADKIWCDSLTAIDGIWTYHVNGVHHIQHEGLQITGNYELDRVVDEQLLVRNVRSGFQSVFDKNGKKLISDQELIIPTANGYLATLGNQMCLYNQYGTKLTKYPFLEVIPGLANYFIAKRNGYWGILDFQGEQYVSFKFDSVRVVKPNYYAVKFLNRWGLTDRHGNWLIKPEYDSISNRGEIVVGHKKYSQNLFIDGELITRSTFRLGDQIGSYFEVVDEEGKVGLMDSRGTITTYPRFVSIQEIDNYLVLKDSLFSTLRNGDGIELISSSDQIQEIGGVGEGFITVKKNGRWGFVDFEGRLRIANRYDDAGVFHERYAPIKLRGKWGVIDLKETLIAQPYYDHISPFEKGLAVVRSGNTYGIINTEGKEVFKVVWKNIMRTNHGNYILVNADNSLGFANGKGELLLSPDFQTIEDLGDKLIVGRNKLKGILDYSGRQIRKIIYSDIQNMGDIILLKR